MYKYTSGAIVAIASIISVATLLSPLGCGRSSSDWQGEWIGKRKVAVPPGGDPDIAVTLNRVQLKIDGSNFILIDGGLPKTGTADFQGECAILHTLRFANRPVDAQGSDRERLKQPINLNWLSSDRIRLTDPASLDPSPVELRRNSKPAR